MAFVTIIRFSAWPNLPGDSYDIFGEGAMKLHTCAKAIFSLINIYSPCGVLALGCITNYRVFCCKPIVQIGYIFQLMRYLHCNFKTLKLLEQWSEY